MSFSFLGIFGAGLLTFLSPCVLPLAPILITSLLLSEKSTPWSRLRSTAWFVTGFTIVFVIMGMSLPLLADALGSAKPFLLTLAGIALALFGAKMMHVLPSFKWLAWMDRTLQLPEFKKKLPPGLHGLLFGSLFGLSWTPCVGPVLGGVLTYVASQQSTPLQSAMKLIPFALGIGLPLLLFAVAYDRVAPGLKRLKKHLPKIEYASGLAVFVFGIFVFNQGRMDVTRLFSTERDANGDKMITAVDSSGAKRVLNDRTNGVARMVFFYSKNCPVCHAMESYLPDFEKNCGSPNFEFVRIDVTNLENAGAAAAFNIKAVPTVSLLNEKGDEMVHLVGYQTESRLRDAAKTTTRLACQGTLPADLKGNDGTQPAESQTCEVGHAC
ncbi:MAG: hypothetical protein A2X94_03985 [Bdellovibrionales bacterium GWB1_55_8]|nr:MAG: hypothetical protein A2X94_03985 [Bdellovibrionales bacterium GWB1_55_8]